MSMDGIRTFLKSKYVNLLVVWRFLCLHMALHIPGRLKQNMGGYTW